MKTVRSSYGDFFTIGEIVGNADRSIGEATISTFEIDIKNNEIKAITDKGWAHVDFLVKQTDKNK